MTFPDPLLILLATMSMTVAMTGVLMCLTQPRRLRIYGVLACFFIAIVLTELGDVFGPVVPHFPTQVALTAVWIVGAATATPLLWLYIWMLTSPDQAWPKHIWLHAVTPVIALMLFAACMLLPVTDQRLLFTEAEGDVSGPAFMFAVSYESYAIFLVTVQWLTYLILSARRLVRYRSRLKDVFASTEGKELRWVAAIIGICGAYWLLGVVLLVLDLTGLVSDPPDAPDYALNLAVDCILVIWGLRQRPGLEPPKPVLITEDAPKYAKSALTEDRASRIAAKLKRAMTHDRLHLDPNLSLWALSKHVGVSDNYVSQVLNEEIGQNFFDFVNSYRVAEAQTLLVTSDETILKIAFDTGFNSRSSFYTAFNKNTGLTPSSYRKTAVRPGGARQKLSCPTVPDDA